MKNQSINLSICLTDIPKTAIKKSKNGKLYVGINIRQRNEPDQFGQDIYAIIAQSKEERELKKDKVYVGNGKIFSFNEKIEEMKPVKAEDLDDLPF